MKNKPVNTKYIGKLSKVDLAKLILENPKGVWTMSIPKDDLRTEVAVGYLKKPDRTSVGMYMAEKRNNQVLAAQSLLDEVWLCGDDSIKKDDDLFYSAMFELEGLLEVRFAELKKN